MPLSELLFSNGNKALVKKRALTYNKFMLRFRAAAEGLLFRREIRMSNQGMKRKAGIVQDEIKGMTGLILYISLTAKMRKGKRMKLQHKIIRLEESLRTGLLAAACFLGVVCLLAGCGTDSRLLSELRQEGTGAFPGTESDGEADGKQDGGNAAENTSDSGGDAEAGAADKAAKKHILRLYLCQFHKRMPLHRRPCPKTDKQRRKLYEGIGGPYPRLVCHFRIKNTLNAHQGA